MQEAFNVMAPFLKDGSYIKIYPDSGKDVGVAMDGKSKWFYTDGPTSL